MLTLALEKPTTCVDHLIDRLSGHRGYCHVDLVFTNGDIFTSMSRAHDGYNAGVVLGHPRPHPPEKWDKITLNLNLDAEEVVRDNARALVGHPYDWAGIWRWVWPWSKEHPEAYFCSEAVVAAFLPDFLPEDTKAWKVSPNDIKDVFAGLIL